MRTVFADAGYWIARLGDHDQLGARAQAVTDALGVVQIVTTQMVLVEVLTHMSRAGARSRRRAVLLVEGLERRSDVEIIPQTAAQFRAALGRYAARVDQRWSPTDCTSFIAMEERGISEALAYDRDFEQAGFVALLREDPA